MIKKLLYATSALILLATGAANAQTDKKQAAPEIQFAPHLFVQVEEGLAVSMFEGRDLTSLVTPKTTINVGYNFSPVWGTRFSASYGQGKSYMTSGDRGKYYAYRNLMLFADGTFNLSSALAGFRKDRKVIFDVYTGAGAIFGLENYQAGITTYNIPIGLKNQWGRGETFFAGRAGIYMGINITPNLQLMIDGGAVVSSDKVDSKIDNRPWVQGSAQLGLCCNFDPNIHEQEVIVKRKDNEARYIAFGFNAFDVINLVTLNVSADINLTKHMALGLVGKFNPWVFNKGTDKEKFDNKRMVYLNTKFYPWYIYDGWHFDVMGGWCDYTQRNSEGLTESGNKFGAGLGAGYTYILTKHLNLELGVGFWLGQKSYNTTPNLASSTVVSSGKEFFIEAYNVQIGLSWVINPGAPKKRVVYEKR